MVILNEDDQILVRALVKYMRSTGGPRREWEKRIKEALEEFPEFLGRDRGLLIEALNIAFRDEATA